MIKKGIGCNVQPVGRVDYNLKAQALFCPFLILRTVQNLKIYEKVKVRLDRYKHSQLSHQRLSFQPMTMIQRLTILVIEYYFFPKK